MTAAEAFEAADAAHRAAFAVFNPIRIAFTKLNSGVSYAEFFAAKKVYDAALAAWEVAERAMIEEAA